MNTLKRYLSISFMMLATLVLIVFAVFPHHHHAEKICLVMEVCDNHDPINEEHPAHHHPDDVNDHNHNCISESDVVITTKEDIKCKVCLCDKYFYLYHFPILFLTADYLIYNDLSAAKPEYGEFIVSYKSINESQTYGLRAPPFLLV